MRKRRANLFQYKCYSEQTELDLSNQEVSTLVATMMEPACTDTQRSTRLMATKILIKVRCWKELVQTN